MTDALASLPTREDLRAAFLARAGHAGTLLVALPADASTRRYFRLEGAGLLLMDSPPDSEPIGPFVRIARQLQGLGLSAPALLEVDEAAGLALIEDFGHDTYTRLLLAGHSESQLYHLAVDTLVALHRTAPATELAPYDGQRLADEYALFIDWYVPLLIGKDAAQDLRDEYLALFADTCRDVAKRREALVLRDFHVDNLMLLQGREGVAACGLLDFQDALKAHPAWDMSILLHDARKDVSPEIEARSLARYFDLEPEVDREQFLADYHALGALNVVRILGIFARLVTRDAKPRYAAFMPRLWGYLDRCLADPQMSGLKAWMDAHVPAESRT